MKRRDVLKVGAIGAVGVATASVAGGCAATPPARNPADVDREAKSFIAMLDKQLGLVDHVNPVEEAVYRAYGTAQPDHVKAKVAEHDGLFRRVLRTLFVTQAFRDLPKETQLHEAVQQRVGSHMDEVDATVFELTDFLARRSHDERTKLREVMREKPEIAMDLGEMLDERAGRMGILKERRKQMRTAMREVTFRLKTESPGSIIDEYAAKVERLRGTDGKSALALSLAEKIGQRAFWKYQHLLAQPGAPQGSPGPGSGQPGPGSGQPGPGSGQPSQPWQTGGPSGAPGQAWPNGQPAGPPAGYMQQPPPQQVYQPPPAREPGVLPMKVGGVMMGIGVVTFGISAALVDTSDAALVGLTVGSVLVGVGLIVLIVGALIYAAN